MPVSPQQLAANRANAAKSTGPRTAQGKSRSAQNAVKHGFRATSFTVVRLEELDEVARLKADLVSTYQPVNSQELFALERAALAQQALLRSYRFESGFFTACLNYAISRKGTVFDPMDAAMVEGHDSGGAVPVTQAHNRNYGMATGFDHMWGRNQSFSALLRYQAQTERLYRRAIEEFNRLKVLRQKLPNEAIPETEIPQLHQDTAAQTNPAQPAIEATPFPGKNPDAAHGIDGPLADPQD